MDKVAIIMSTYNGEKYIQEQIDSILAQEGIEPVLFIRDDGSKDSTVDIIEDYSSRCLNVIFQNRGDIQNFGVKKSFLLLLKWVVDNYPDINYLSFADQDDFWEKDKLVEAVKMHRGESKWLYFSNKTAVDENLNILYTEHLVYHADCLEIFWGSQASGCTMLFSHMLAKIVLEHSDTPNEIDLIHDSLMYRAAHVVGATISFDERSFIKYRQHGHNVIGIEQSTKTNKDWKGLLKKSPHFISDLSARLRGNYRDELSDEGKKYLDLVCSYRSNIASRWKLILDRKAMKRGYKLYLIWVGKLVLGRL